MAGENKKNMSDTNTPPRLYALTPIDQTEGLEDGRYIVTNGIGKFEVNYDSHYGFHEEFTDCSGLEFYLRPLPPGTQTIEPGMVEKMLSYESLQPLVERIAYEQMSADQLGDLVAKMDLIKQFIQTKLAQMGE